MLSNAIEKHLLIEIQHYACATFFSLLMIKQLIDVEICLYEIWFDVAFAICQQQKRENNCSVCLISTSTDSVHLWYHFGFSSGMIRIDWTRKSKPISRCSNTSKEAINMFPCLIDKGYMRSQLNFYHQEKLIFSTMSYSNIFIDGKRRQWKEQRRKERELTFKSLQALERFIT